MFTHSLIVAGTLTLIAMAGAASADHAPPTAPDRTADRTPLAVQRLLDGQHGGASGHLPATAKNVELVGKLELTGRFGDVLDDQIADLSVFEDTAYLNSVADGEAQCPRGGTYVVDVRRPDRPREIGFLAALTGTYHSEGAHVVAVETRFFRGNLLAVNNEFCANRPMLGAGFDLYDVTDPRKPKALVQGFGDRGGEGSPEGDDSRCARGWRGVDARDRIWRVDRAGRTTGRRCRVAAG